MLPQLLMIPSGDVTPIRPECYTARVAEVFFGSPAVTAQPLVL